MADKIKSKKIKMGGRDVHYFITGRGDPLVVIHGGAGDAKTWLDNATMLSDKYKVYVPDLPGFGKSQPLDGDYNIQGLTEFVDKFTDKLGLESFHLMGHSIGGGVALNYALKSPHRIKRLVLVSSLCLGREISLWIRITSIPGRAISSAILTVPKAIKWLIRRLSIPVELIMPSFRASLNLGISIATLKEQTLVLANRLSELMMPTLLVWGAKDKIVPVRHAYAAIQTIPDGQLKVFGKRGHNVHRDEINEFSRLLTGFLS